MNLRHPSLPLLACLALSAIMPAYAQQASPGLALKSVFFGDRWSGEQIDPQSGNLNYSYPLLYVKSGRAWQIPLQLSYNSQFWTLNSGGARSLAQDVGYGYGWTLSFGAIQSSQSASAAKNFSFRDGSGAAHPLQPNGAAWTSPREGLTYDPVTQTLFLQNGSRWILGATSAAGEPDAGTLYPTSLIDPTGHQITVSYQPGVGSSVPNTSARIATITGASGVTTFVYSPDNHLSEVTGASVPGNLSSFGFTASEVQIALRHCGVSLSQAAYCRATAASESPCHLLL